MIFALTGCVKVDARMAVNEDNTVTGSIVMAVDKRLASLTGKSQDQLVSTITVAPETIAKGTVVQPYQDDAFVGRRYVFTNVPLSEFHGTDQVSISLVHDGRAYLFNGVADLRTVNLADPAVQRFADQFAFTVSVTFPGPVVESNGVVNGRTVTWSPKAGESQPMHARAEMPANTWVPWALGLGLLLVIVTVVIFVAVLSRRRPAD
jgi:Protein of unknown function (DUF3153)